MHIVLKKFVKMLMKVLMLSQHMVENVQMKMMHMKLLLVVVVMVVRII